MSRKTIVVYECDRCGKRMDSPYVSFTMKRNSVIFNEEIDFANKDLCVDCFDKITFLMNNPDAMVVSTSSCVFSSENLSKNVKKPTEKDFGPFTVTCKDSTSISDHLDVTCI